MVGRQKGTVELKLNETQIAEVVTSLHEAMPMLVKGAAQADASKVFCEYATKGTLLRA